MAQRKIDCLIVVCGKLWNFIALKKRHFWQSCFNCYTYRISRTEFFLFKKDNKVTCQKSSVIKTWNLFINWIRGKTLISYIQNSIKVNIPITCFLFFLPLFVFWSIISLTNLLKSSLASLSDGATSTFWRYLCFHQIRTPS